MHWFPVRIYQPSEAFYLAAGSRELLQRKSTLHPGWVGLFVVVVIVFSFFFYDIFLFMKLSECEVQGCHGNWCKQPPVTWGTAVWYLSPPWGLPLPPCSHCFMGASQDAALYSKPNIGHTGSPCLTAMSRAKSVNGLRLTVSSPLFSFVSSLDLAMKWETGVMVELIFCLPGWKKSFLDQ